MIRSFRLRLALLSAALCGVVLAAFGIGTWSLIRDLRLSHIEQDVRENAEREARRVRTPEDWRRIERKLNASLGVRNDADLLLLICDPQGQIIYRSEHAATAKFLNDLPWPQQGKRALPAHSLLFSSQTAHAAESVPTAPERSQQPPPLEVSPANELPPASSNLQRQADGHLWVLGLASSQHSRVALAVNTALIDEEMRGIRNAFLLTSPCALLLIGLGAWFFSGRAMRPLNKLTAATQRVAADKLNLRLAKQGEDNEFALLIEHYNQMLARLERSFQQANRFSADAAHELKTPLAILQGQLERAMSGVEPGSPIQIELSSILDEVRRLSSISRKLLLLAQADAGCLRLLCTPFDLSATLNELVEDIHLLAPELRVDSQIATDLIVPADATLLPQILHNLISNAIKYNIADGWISLQASGTATQVQIRVSNATEGLSQVARDHLFERFFRADTAHNRKIDGVGLGLSVSREIARAHGGEISVTLERAGEISFILQLPCKPQEATSPA